MSEQLIAVEQARLDDAEAIASLLERNREVATLLLQPVEQVRARIDEFVLVRGPGRVWGCAQLRRHRPMIREIMSVAVDPAEHGRGIGSACVRACVTRALEQRATLIWLATTSPEFFARLGFVPIPMRTIPAMVLLGKLAAVVRQPIRRWPAALLGGQQFMRWPAREELGGEYSRGRGTWSASVCRGDHATIGGQRERSRGCGGPLRSRSRRSAVGRLRRGVVVDLRWVAAGHAALAGAAAGRGAAGLSWVRDGLVAAARGGR